MKDKEKQQFKFNWKSLVVLIVVLAMILGSVATAIILSIK